MARRDVVRLAESAGHEMEAAILCGDRELALEILEDTTEELAENAKRSSYVWDTLSWLQGRANCIGLL
jgi:hypothetical protein